MHRACPHCRSPVEIVEAATSAEIVCPSCGSSFRLEGGSTAPWAASDGARKLGRFELLDEIGTGAFGTVYRARDPQLDRVVALKVPRAGSLPGGPDLDRFLREARSAAQLRHPAIVSVHEAGQADGLVYLVSDFVAGLTLADRLSGGRLTFAQAARLGAALADALEYAHRQGVVHRDVKPSNVLLDTDGNPHLTDFGLAKREGAEITVTQDGQVLGTPAYMSPEQAAGQAHAVDGRCDVYSLGVVLYQLLTGELPFRGTTRMLLHQVLHDDPRPPRSLNDAIPRDLQTVCLKAMAREPGRRYQTAGELADDLRRFLAGEPVRARPAGRLERAVRWVRRRPAAAALLVTGLAAVAGLSAAVASWRSNAALHDLNGKLEAAADEAEGQRRRAVAGEERARRFHYAGDLALAQLRLDNVHHTDDVKQVLELLDRHRPGPEQEDLRGFEWYYLWRRCHLHRLTLRGDPAGPGPADHPDTPLWVTFTPDGDLVTASARGTIRVCDPAKGTWRKSFEVGQIDLFAWASLALRPDRRTLVVKNGDPWKEQVGLWDLRTGTQRSRLWQARPAPKGKLPEQLAQIVLSPDGASLGLAGHDGVVRILDAETGKELQRLSRGAKGGALALGSGGGPLLAALGGSDGRVGLWDVATGTELATLAGHEDAVRAVAFSPDGRFLATAGAPGKDGRVQLWDVGQVRGGRRTARATLAPKGEVLRLVFAPDGRTLATAAGPSSWKGPADICLWDTESGSGKERCRLNGHEGGVLALAFSPDSTTVATAGFQDGVVRVWAVRNGRQRARLVGHTVPVFDLAFSPDGRTLATAGGPWASGADRGRQGEVRLWDRQAWDRPEAFRGSPDWALAPDGRALALGNGKIDSAFNLPTAVTLWDLDGDRSLASLPGDSFVAFSPDSRILATANREWPPFLPPGKTRADYPPLLLKLWDVRSGKLLATQPGIQGEPFLLFSPDGEILATCTSGPARGGIGYQTDLPGAAVTLRDGTTGAPQLSLQGGWGPLQFSADGRTLLSHGEQGSVKVWDVSTGRLRRTLVVPGRRVWRFALSGDGKTALLGYNFDGKEAVKLFDLASGAERAALGDLRSLRCLALSPDGQSVATGHGDGPVGAGWIKLWDAATGTEQVTLGGHRSQLLALRFAPDGKRLFSASATEAKVWDPVIGQDLLTLPGGYGVQLSRDGRTLATGPGSNTDSEVRLWTAASDEEVRARRGGEVRGAGP